jgi:CRISPR-associated protein Cas2
MFIILFYDVDVKRVVRMLKTCRKYLQWQQNSVFEGEITEGKLAHLQSDIQKIIKPDDGDSVIIYTFRTMQYSNRIVMGTDKKKDISFI